jgi:hypothetical protein
VDTYFDQKCTGFLAWRTKIFFRPNVQNMFFSNKKSFCHILVNLLKLFFVSRNSILRCTFIEQLFKIAKKNISKFQSVFLIFEIFFLKNGTVFRAKVELFLVLPKFDWKKIFQEFRKKMVQEGWNYYKMLKEIDFWPSAGRESLWTTIEKVGFSKAHCEVQKQPNLDFSVRGLNPRPLLKSNLHMKSLGLDPWPPGSSKSPIFPNYEVNWTKYIRNLKSADHGRTLFGPSTSLRRKNCRGVWPVVRLTAIWNCAFHHMEHPQLWSHLSRYPQREIDWFLRKNKRIILVLSYFRQFRQS